MTKIDGIPLYAATGMPVTIIKTLLSKDRRFLVVVGSGSDSLLRVRAFRREYEANDRGPHWADASSATITDDLQHAERLAVEALIALTGEPNDA